MRIYTIYGEEFGERVLGNLANPPKFCISCGLACIECRTSYGSFAADIFGVHKLPEQSQHFIDNPKDYFPKVVPTCDVVLAIGIHPDLLAELTWFVQRSKAKAVIAPIEDRSWCPPSLSRELQTKLTEMSVESAFPKPFCALDETGASVIDQFLKRYKIGKPLLELELKNDIITNTKVLRSAPCGSTWYVAEQIKWQNTRDIQELEQAISKAHHGYPCTASMETDPELGETILHRSGYIVRDAVKDAIVNGHRIQVCASSCH